jgi:hypothetical protein
MLQALNMVVSTGVELGELAATEMEAMEGMEAVTGAVGGMAGILCFGVDISRSLTKTL